MAPPGHDRQLRLLRAADEIDDWVHSHREFFDPFSWTNVQERFLQSAVQAALEGKKPEVSETVPIGCRIRFDRVRRTRRKPN